MVSVYNDELWLFCRVTFKMSVYRTGFSPVRLVNILFRQAGVSVFLQVTPNPVAGVELVGRVHRIRVTAIKYTQ